MTRRVLVFAILCGVIPSGAAIAAPASGPFGMRQVHHRFGGTVTLPPEWDGIYTAVDSVYDCDGNLTAVETFNDTLCAGETYTGDEGIPLVCTGSITATTIDIVCDASGPIFQDCDAVYHVEVHGTGAAGSYFTVSNQTITYSGTGTGCDLLPPYCGQVNTHGTRLGPAPPAYCATPTKASTWGRLKSVYR